MRGFSTDPAEIEKESMRLIREQLKKEWTSSELPVVERLIHTSGDINLEEVILIHSRAIEAGLEALRQGASIITDVEMVRAGVSKAGLAKLGSRVECFLNDPRVPEQAKAWGLTRSMTAFRLNAERLAGAIVAIGNAPTALMEVLRLAENPAHRPALIIGMPVGFVGAAEAKEALWNTQEFPSITLRGTRGGSPLAATVVNALLYTLLKSSQPSGTSSRLMPSQTARLNDRPSLTAEGTYRPSPAGPNTIETEGVKLSESTFGNSSYSESRNEVILSDSTRKPRALSLMFQGTSSNVGKSVLTAAFCRIFYQEGYLTSPFKAQNMALNSFVTTEGGEMGRAQVVQAQAAGREPDVKMNPILLKPTGQASSQVILLGKAQETLPARRYHEEYQKLAWPVVQSTLNDLCENNEILVIEGAGSPAEVNLKHNDIVNMRVAKEIQAPVLLVADIDRGGALASVVGTLELLEEEERRLVKGIILNKFRGDIQLLQPALDFLKEKTGIPVLGVVPYYTEFAIPEEDSVGLEKEKRGGGETLVNVSGKLDIAVIRLPYISNFTDFDALRDEPDVSVRYVNDEASFGQPDLVILPGSKNTLFDLQFLHESGLSARIKEGWRQGLPVIGICGGYQMLGMKIHDPLHTESNLDSLSGLEILPLETEFYPEKHTVQSKGKVISGALFLQDCQNENVEGYEIHMGHSTFTGEQQPLFELNSRNQTYPDGLQAGSALGTYLHGIFDNDALRRSMLNWLWEKRGQKRVVESDSSQAAIREQALNQLAELVRQNVDLPAIRNIMGLSYGSK